MNVNLIDFNWIEWMNEWMNDECIVSNLTIYNNKCAFQQRTN